MFFIRAGLFGSVDTTDINVDGAMEYGSHRNSNRKRRDVPETQISNGVFCQCKEITRDLELTTTTQGSILYNSYHKWF